MAGRGAIRKEKEADGGKMEARGLKILQKSSAAQLKQRAGRNEKNMDW